MNQAQRAAVYMKAQRACLDKLRAARSVLTLKLHGGYVPVRIVKRGEERFVNFVDA